MRLPCFQILFFLLLILSPRFSSAQGIESSFESKQNSSGGQEIHARTKSDYGSYQLETEQHHTTDRQGGIDEMQKATYTGPDGKQYSETNWREYDPWTGEWKEGHRIEGEPPKDIPEPDYSKIKDGGVRVEGNANGEPVKTDYGPGGLQEEWPDGRKHWIDLDKGATGHIDPNDQTAQEVEGIPARTIPLICHVSSLSMPPVDLGFTPQGFAEEFMKNPEAAQKMIEKLEKGMKKLQSELPRMKLEALSVEEVVWKKPPRFWGYPVKSYLIFQGKGSQKKKRADIWTVPQIKLWDILKGKNQGREKYIERMLVPHWEGVSLAKQKEIFSSLTVLFIDYAYGGRYYIAEEMEKLPQYVFHRPLVPAGYAVTKIDRKEIESMAKETQTLFWQGMNR